MKKPIKKVTKKIVQNFDNLPVSNVIHVFGKANMFLEMHETSLKGSKGEFTLTTRLGERVVFHIDEKL